MILLGCTLQRRAFTAAVGVGVRRQQATHNFQVALPSRAEAGGRCLRAVFFLLKRKPYTKTWRQSIPSVGRTSRQTNGRGRGTPWLDAQGKPTKERAKRMSLSSWVSWQQDTKESGRPCPFYSFPPRYRASSAQAPSAHSEQQDASEWHCSCC